MTRIGRIMRETVPFLPGHGQNEDEQDARIALEYGVAWLDDTFADVS
jgi:hypothetical protein